MAASYEGDNRHAQQAFKELGIVYKHAIPQTMGDQWWFLDCEFIPENLPRYITELELTDEEYKHWTK